MGTKKIVKTLTISFILLMVVYSIVSSGFYLFSFGASLGAFELLRIVGGGLLVLLIANMVLLTLVLALQSFDFDSDDGND